MNNPELNTGSLANRPKVQYGGGERRRGKRIGGLAQVVDGVPPRESNIDAYRQKQIDDNLAKAQQRDDREAQARALRVSQAKANGTFPGIQEKFNRESTTQVMDDNGDIMPRTTPAAPELQRPQQEPKGGGGFTLLQDGPGNKVKKAAQKVVEAANAAAAAVAPQRQAKSALIAAGALKKAADRVQQKGWRTDVTGTATTKAKFGTDGRVSLDGSSEESQDGSLPRWGRQKPQTGGFRYVNGRIELGKGKAPGGGNARPSIHYNPLPFKGGDVTMTPLPFKGGNITMRLLSSQGGDATSRQKFKNIIQARAKGGPVKKGRPYLVDEKGPELVVPEEDGVVIPNEVIVPWRKAAKGRGGKCAPKAGGKDKAAWFAREARRWRGLSA